MLRMLCIFKTKMPKVAKETNRGADSARVVLVSVVEVLCEVVAQASFGG